tara:strand:- start:717 stop:1802 length:1086 start_codon:yes stop_codon:yes gene_type:complete
MRKILLISNGDSIHTIRWTKELQSKYKIFLFDWRPINQENYINLENVMIVSNANFFSKKVPFLSFIISFLKIKEISKNIAPDIIHSHYATSYGLLGVRAKKNKLIISVWGSDLSDFPNKSLLHKYLIKYLLKKSEYIFSTSNFLRKKVKEITSRNSTITPFGVEILKYNEIKKNTGLITFGVAKNLKSSSGIELAIRCFYKLKKANKEKKIKFQIAGDGPLRPKIESIIKELDLENEVSLLGHLNHKDIYIFMKKIDVYINLPQEESFGVAVLEASAAGKPVIVSDVGGLSEVVKDGVTGTIVDLKNEDQIVRAMDEMVCRKDKRDLMGANGIKFVEKNYSWEKSKEIMLDSYKKILNDEI